MRRSLTLTAFLVITLSVAACGGSEPQQSEQAAGLSVTTLQGEQVSVGGQGDVTALFFMAGW